MSKLRDKLNTLDKDKIKQKWETLDSQKGLSTREKLEKLVNLNLKRDKFQKNEDKSSFRQQPIENSNTSNDEDNLPFTCKEYNYPLYSKFGKVELSDWHQVTSQQLGVIFRDEVCESLSPEKVLFFDTETTGLAGGTGTIPFMLGFGFFTESDFRVKIYILNDLGQEDAFLEEIDRFLETHDFSATITYNGKSFDFPLMETRYILQRKRFPLLKLPHFDFLFSARTIWKHTYESRKLGYLGDVLLGLSREEDIIASQIPAIYFNYLRTQSFSLMEKIVYHNSLDLVGLAALILLAVYYLQDVSAMQDEGEILGTAKLFEKYGELDKALRLYDVLVESATRQEIVNEAVKSLAVIKKKKKLYDEALEWWHLLSQSGSSNHLAARELSVHFEHREKNYLKAFEYSQKALDSISMTEAQRNDFQKRLKRLKRKMEILEREE